MARAAKIGARYALESLTSTEPNPLSMASDLTQLDQYAGGDAYPIASHPIRGFAAMANAVTDDLILIYARIERLTDQDAWGLQPPGIPNPIQPVYR